jgi:hypothetical protein
METFINKAQIDFNNYFIEYKYVYSMFVPIRHPQDCPGVLLKRLYLHWVDGVAQLDAFRCLQGFCRGEDIIALRSKKLIVSPVRYAHRIIKEDTPCIIFPIGHVPGVWNGFIAQTPDGHVKYLSDHHSRNKPKEINYVFLKLSNSGKSMVYDDWDTALEASYNACGARVNVLLRV